MSLLAFVLELMLRKHVDELHARRLKLPRCSAECNRPPFHPRDKDGGDGHCKCESPCDYDEHSDRCACLFFKDFGLGRCECGGFRWGVA